MVYIIVKDKESSMRTIRGKTVAEFDRNMEKEGWPTEFSSEEARDRFAFEEKKRGRAIRKEEISVFPNERVEAIKELDRRGGVKIVPDHEIQPMNEE